MTIARTKTKKCKACRVSFFPVRPMQSVCSPGCAAALIKAKADKQTKDKAKEQRKQDRARLLELKPPAYWADRAQKQVNRYVRLRDKGKPCISCGAPWSDTFQAGHWLSRGARPELRYHLDNIHGQCIHCNHHKSGNASVYRVNLVALIGVQRVEALEGPHSLPRWRKEDYQRIEAQFKQMADEMEKETA